MFKIVNNTIKRIKRSVEKNLQQHIQTKFQYVHVTYTLCQAPYAKIVNVKDA